MCWNPQYRNQRNPMTWVWGVIYIQYIYGIHNGLFIPRYCIHTRWATDGINSVHPSPPYSGTMHRSIHKLHIDCLAEQTSEQNIEYCVFISCLIKKIFFIIISYIKCTLQCVFLWAWLSQQHPQCPLNKGHHRKLNQTKTAFSASKCPLLLTPRNRLQVSRTPSRNNPPGYSLLTYWFKSQSRINGY